MAGEFDNIQGHSKTAGELGREGLWFAAHTLIAVLILFLVVAGISLTNPDIENIAPKLIGTLLALLVPMIGGLIIAKIRQDRTATYVWISGLLFFSLVCVWVLDLPTGAGLCDKCGAVDKLYRTFYDINHGSGLMDGDGLLLGTWIPLSMIGYAIGARFGLNE